MVIISRWYQVPALLYNINLNLPKYCWQCHQDCCISGGLALKYNPFGLEYILWSPMRRLTPSTTQFLLHHTSLSQRAYHKSLAMHMVNVAKLCIPIHWNMTHTPSLRMVHTPAEKHWYGRTHQPGKWSPLQIHSYLGLFAPLLHHWPLKTPCSLPGLPSNWANDLYVWCCTSFLGSCWRFFEWSICIPPPPGGILVLILLAK